MPDLGQQVVKAIRSVTGNGEIALHEPEFSGNEQNYLSECLESTFVSSIGKYVDKFESQLVNFTGAKYAISVVNGTSALHIALKLAGVIAQDEVLIPALTFVGTANAVVYCGAIPHLIDSEPNTLGVDPRKLRRYLTSFTTKVNGNCVNKKTGRVIRAVVPMHTFGLPVQMEELQEVASEFKLEIIEDAAESLGSRFNGKHTGTFGTIGILSFNGNKIITTGGGGAILTDNKDLALRAKHLTTTAKVPHKWEFSHDEVGFNYRMPNINAAIGCAQIEALPQKLIAKRELHLKYRKAFTEISEVDLIHEPANSESNYWLNTLRLRRTSETQLIQILEATNSVKITTRPVWKLISELGIYPTLEMMDLSISNELSQTLINLPSSPKLNASGKI